MMTKPNPGKKRRKLRPRHELVRINIDRYLKKYLPKGGGVIKKAMRYSVLSGGKRIRPLVVLEASRICGGSDKDAIPVACAVEFIHTYSLIHDDLPAMDNDDFRRGKPTCHKVFGEANAILAGDALLTLAFNVIARYTEPGKGAVIAGEIAQAIGDDGMVGGQALDLELHKRKNAAVSRKINLLKTAKLFEAAAKAGALSAGAGAAKARALQKFGLYFGLSFQAVDDHLDRETAARKEAFTLIKKAKKELLPFGKKADKLKAMADLAVKRTV